MKNLLYVLQLSLTVLLAASQHNVIQAPAKGPRRFEVDWEGDTFRLDGEPFRFIAGSFHYFRAHPETWQKKLRTMRAAGLNAVTTYVEWSLHNPKEGKYVWDGIADVERFIRLAQVEGLYVILRPGPYICAERDNGGFPYWLLRKYPDIQLRTADINYLSEVRKWYSELMPRMDPYLYENGGPIIMVQVENEYGSFRACDRKYREWLRDETFNYVRNKAVLFTNDGPSQIGCGFIPGVLATLDFGSTSQSAVYWQKKKNLQPRGPLVNAEYYPGWLTHWSEPLATVDTDPVLKTLTVMLNQNASVNFYMFFGGTNFGFTAGANDGGPGKYQPDITSYDYDAPMDEAGNPTQKYHDLRAIIGKYLPLPDIPVPDPTPSKHYGTISLTACCSILSSEGRNALAERVVSNFKPLTFEALDQYSGFVLYETYLPKLTRDPSVLRITDLRDRAYVYVDRQFVGVLSRESQVNTLAIMPGMGNKLQILVENQGRINYNIPNDFKGILSDVLIDKTVLKDFNMTQYPLESYNAIANLINREGMPKNMAFRTLSNRALLRSGPTVFYGTIDILDKDPADTYLDTKGWGKGLAFINGFNLGRYWPVIGPQITLYIPRELLKTGTNDIVFIEYQKSPESAEITLTDVPNLNGN